MSVDLSRCRKSISVVHQKYLLSHPHLILINPSTMILCYYQGWGATRSQKKFASWSRSRSKNKSRSKNRNQSRNICGTYTSSWKIKSIRILYTCYFSLGKIGGFHGLKKIGIVKKKKYLPEAEAAWEKN